MIRAVNGDGGELLRPGGVLSILVGVCLAIAGVAISLVTVYELGLWRPDLPYLARLAGLLPFGIGDTLIISAVVMLSLGIVGIIGGVLVVKGNGDAGGIPSAGGFLGIFVGVCLAVMGGILALAVAYESGVWQPGLPYLARFGTLLPVEAGNRLLIAAIVVLVVGIGIIIGGVSAVRRAGSLMAEEEQRQIYFAPESPDSSMATTTASRRAAAAELRTPVTRVETGTGGVAETEVVPPASATRAAEAPVADPATRRSRVELESLDATRLARAKAGFCTRRVPKEDMRTLVTGAVRPRAGDLVLARIERVRQHRRIELATGRKARLEQGDEVILACGNRYAADQFEGFVPERLGPAHLIAAGGVAAVEAKRARSMKPATAITLLGLVGDASGNPLNLASYALPAADVQGTWPPVIAVFGTSMNSGKTTAVCFLCRGLTAAGFKVGYAKLTGTGAGNDYWRVLDSGAWAAVDFSDAGLVSTYLAPISVIEHISVDLIGHLVARGCDRIVVEIADGLLQVETARVLHSETFHALIDRVVFTSGDSMSAIAGVRMLKEHGFDVAGVSGLLTASPLPVCEASGALDVPVLSNDDLANPDTAGRLVSHVALALETPRESALRQDTGQCGQSPQPGETSDSMEDQE